jgi:hypothetical protein
MNQSGREGDAEIQDVDDLGLTQDDRDSLAIAYNFGTIEPVEGTAEAEAFRRMTEYAHRECDRVHEAHERDHSYARFQERPFPGGPITAGLTNHEAAELSDRLYSAHAKAVKAEREADWQSGQRKQFGELDREVWDVYADVEAEQVVSGIRRGAELQHEFFERVAQEEPQVLNPRVLAVGELDPDMDPDPEPELPF